MNPEFTFIAMGSDIVEDFAGCSEPVCISHGDVHRADVPFAMYVARWFDGNRSKGIDLQITVGEWTPKSTWQQRHTVGLHARLLDGTQAIVFVDPDSVWGCEGVPYTPIDADRYPVGAMAKKLALAILDSDPAIAAFLRGLET